MAAAWVRPMPAGRERAAARRRVQAQAGHPGVEAGPLRREAVAEHDAGRMAHGAGLAGGAAFGARQAHRRPVRGLARVVVVGGPGVVHAGVQDRQRTRAGRHGGAGLRRQRDPARRGQPVPGADHRCRPCRARRGIADASPEPSFRKFSRLISPPHCAADEYGEHRRVAC